MATSLPHATVAVLSPTPGPQTPCERLGRHADWTGMPAFRVLLSELGLVMPQEPGANLNFVKTNTSTTPRGSPRTVHQQSHHPGLRISVNRYPSAYCTLLGPGWIWEARPTPGHSPWGGFVSERPVAGAEAGRRSHPQLQDAADRSGTLSHCSQPVAVLSPGWELKAHTTQSEH